ncbi:effector-associated constant component EACC1 [Glycomyces terrestris]|uniref:Uncharacterized protein n=1 Tax=Glycomyces terrestris TaxID=2493553 RepID=A0A426UVN8_9ACTN|nr:hypothetical protein [Glycomyces terrestris]RRR98390.1 hypothetical protein EIW28_15970 [Glycomyces terrestris]
MTDADLLSITAETGETPDLLAMLRRDPDLNRAGITLSTADGAGSGETLGDLTDTIHAVVANDALLTAATTTIGVWLGARIRPTRIRVRRGDVEVEVETVRAKRADAYARELLDALSDREE